MTSGSGSDATGTIVFDLDGTLCTNTFGDYERAEPHEWAIERVNELAAAGHRIVILTARGSATGIDWEQRTHEQLRRWGVRYDELRLGKPSGDVYVDDRAVHTDSWRRGDVFLPPGFPLTADRLPPAAAPELAAVAEVGRTFAGEPLRLDQHARRASELASAAGIVGAPGAGELAGAVREAIADAAPADEGDDLVYTISIAGAAHAALLDDWTGTPAALRATNGVRVNRRRLRDAARGLRPPLARPVSDGGPVVDAATVGDAAAPPAADGGAPDGWPLVATPDGAVADALGGTLALISGDRVVLSQPPAGDVTSAWLGSLAPDAGLEVASGAVTADELQGFDEAALVGVPFCLLPIVAIDGRRLPGGAPGPATSRLLAAWSAEAGLDLPAQLGALSA